MATSSLRGDIGLIDHYLFPIMDVEALLGILHALALEVVPSSLAFGEGWGEVTDTCRAILSFTKV